MRILVFGSNGLVGSNVKNVLLETSNECLFSSREDTDLFDLNSTLQTIKKFQPNIIINCAARVGGINANDKNRTIFLLENLKINMNIFESLMSLDPIKVINLGSSCIYPLDALNPISESSIMSGKLEPTNSAYAMAKLTAIELGNSIKKEFGHNIINLMPTNLYGKYDNFSKDDSHVIPGLIYRMHDAKINSQKKFSVWGTGTPLREFLNAMDFAKSILFIIENNINDDLLNIGSNEEVSIKELASIIQKTINYEGEIIFDEEMPDGNPRKLLDSTKIFNYGWKPEIKLEQGLKDAYEWFKSN